MKKLAQLGWSFFWITSVTLGGGMAMLPLLDREFVERRGWMTSQEMLDIVAVMQSLPGIIALNMSVLIGYRLKGVAGAAVAVVASRVTPFAVIAAIVIRLILNKKKGRSSCGCGCDNCPMGGSCHQDPKGNG